MSSPIVMLANRSLRTVVVVSTLLAACASVPINGPFLQYRDSKGHVFKQVETATPGTCKMFVEASDIYVSPARFQCVATSAGLAWEAELHAPSIDLTVIYSAETEEACLNFVKSSAPLKNPQIRQPCHKVR